MFRVEDLSIPLVVDLRRMGLSPADLEHPGLDRALSAMQALEAGAIANPDESRQVGHFWLRSPDLAPATAAAQIHDSWSRMEALVHRVQGHFDTLFVIGIGGSALGPMLLGDALSPGPGGMSLRVLDNTDPEGLERHLGAVDLSRALFVVISKSGGTQETRNGMLEAMAACARKGLRFEERALAITVPGSALDKLAQGWLASLPMWDWVGGRFSITSLVGLLPLALMGRNWRALLAGAAAMDRWTRQHRDNPALLMALAWYRAGEGKGRRAMVVLPYKDRLLLFSRYLQQLVMESLGKALDRKGREVHQGLTVYGNKGSTDQHAFVQQLRDGPDDCFATFIFALQDREGPDLEVAPGVTSGDYLLGFLLGTRNALTQVGRRSLSLLVDRIDERSLGALIALYERAVGLYAELIDVNAYHQPGVEAGKKAAAEVLRMQARILAGEMVEESDDLEVVLMHLGRNGRLK